MRDCEGSYYSGVQRKGLAYAARKARENWVVVVNGVEGRPFARIGAGSVWVDEYTLEPKVWEGDGGLRGGGPVFTEDGPVRYLAWRSNTVFEVGQEVAAPIGRRVNSP